MKNLTYLLILLFAFNSCDFIKQMTEKKQEKAVEENTVASKPKIKNGVKKYYFDTGELKSIVNYKNNKKVGISETFYKSGEKQYDIPYVDGMKHGVVKWYYKDGKVYRETDYIKGKKSGYQRKFWENGKLKSEAFYKDNLASIGLKEISKTDKKKSTPTIEVQKINLLKTKQEYVLKFKLSTGRKKVKFYQAKLIDGKFFPENGGKGIKELKTVAGVGELRIPVGKGFNIDKDINIVAVESTAYQNKRIISKKVHVSVRNPL